MPEKLKKCILIVTISILAIVCVFATLYIPKRDVHVSVPYNAHTFRLLASNNTFLPYDIESFWVDGTVHFIVPSNAPDEITITIIDETDFSEHSEKISIKQTRSINDVPINIVKSKLPTMYISLDGSETANIWEILDSTDTTKEQQFPGQLQIAGAGNSLDNVREMILTRHGNASWDMCKKRSFNIKLPSSESILGLKKSKSYVLIGNGKDKTLMRNYMANELAKKLNCNYTVDMKYVTLYVDGVYRGLYLLSEKPKKVMKRALKNNSSESFAVNFMSVDKDYVIPFSYSNGEFDGDEEQSEGNGYSVNLILPEEDRLSYEYYQGKVQQLMDEMGSGDFSNIDIDSFVKYYWVQEATKNYDAWYRSLYFVYNADKNKWQPGTPWDFDMSWNYFSTCTEIDFCNPYGLIGSHGIYKDLYLNEDAKEKLSTFYKTKVVRALSEVRKEMYDVYDIIEEEARLDYQSANNDREIPICTEEYFDITFGTTYDEAFQNFVDYFDERNRHLNDIFFDRDD